MTPGTPSPRTHGHESAAARHQAAGRLLGRFELLLGASAIEDGEASFEELRRAVDGGADPVETALWAERLAGNPGLGARAEALASFREEAYPRPARVVELANRRREAPWTPWLGWGAVAATLLVTVLLRGGETSVPSTAALGVPSAAPAAIEPSAAAHELFVDGFEAGDSSHWDAISTSG